MIKPLILALLVLEVGGCGDPKPNGKIRVIDLDETIMSDFTVNDGDILAKDGRYYVVGADRDWAYEKLRLVQDSVKDITRRIDRLAADSANHANVDMSKWPWMTVPCDSFAFQFHCDRCDRLAADSARCAELTKWIDTLPVSLDKGKSYILPTTTESAGMGTLPEYCKWIPILRQDKDGNPYVIKVYGHDHNKCDSAKCVESRCADVGSIRDSMLNEGVLSTPDTCRWVHSYREITDSVRHLDPCNWENGRQVFKIDSTWHCPGETKESR